jgi:hypothetical protein
MEHRSLQSQGVKKCPSSSKQEIVFFSKAVATLQPGKSIVLFTGCLTKDLRVRKAA